MWSAASETLSDARAARAIARDRAARAALDDFALNAGPGQTPPRGAWRVWVFLGGRGAGKTRAGAEWVHARVAAGRARRVALIGQTHHDVRDVMIEGASGLLHSGRVRPAYEPSRRRLVWPNGAQAFAFSAEEPVGRFDLGNRVRLRVPGGGLARVGRRAALDGANLFAIGQADGRFELVAIAALELVGSDLYEASILLRGLQGTEDAMGAPAVAGAVVVKIDARLARLAVGADRAAAGSRIFAAAAGFAPSSAVRGWPLAGMNAWARPFAPAHLRARRRPDGAIRFTWIRRSRLGGDSWAVVDAPLGEERERYRLDILDGASPVRTVETERPSWDYAETAQIADFGGRPSWLRWRVAQISATAGPGGSRESSGPL
jgi:hypothetical protein